MSETQTSTAIASGQQEGGESQEEARKFLMALAQLVSVSRFHQLDNEAVRAPLALISEWTGRLCTGGEKFTIFTGDGQVFVNSKRLRLSGGAYKMIQGFIQVLGQRKLGGIEIRGPVSVECMRSFLACFNGVPRGTEDPAGFIEKSIAESGFGELGILRPGGQGGGKDRIHVADDIELAALLYAKAVVLLRETVRNWENEETRNYLGARATRVIQGIIALAERNSGLFLWLVNVKNDGEYLYTHGANVALLSILLGLRLGIDRNRLCDLGAAALFHDLGRIGLPEEVRSKEGRFSDEDLRAMKRHPIHGVNLLLQLKRFNHSLLNRLVVVFEHNIVSNGYPRSSWPRGLHIYSRIVAIADAYDAMTTRRPFRPARTPDEALRELRENAGNRYDGDLVAVFANVMGIYPLGTLVRLDTGELALVYHVDPAAPRRPLVKVIRAADGSAIPGGKIIDLGECDGSGAWPRSIAGTVDAVSLGIKVSSYLWESKTA